MIWRNKKREKNKKTRKREMNWRNRKREKIKKSRKREKKN